MAKQTNLDLIASLGADTEAIKAKWKKWKELHPKNEYPVGKIEKDLWDGVSDAKLKEFVAEAVKELLG